MRIAVVGAGISGLSCAWRLSQAHEVTLYEANDYFGGHSHTVDATVDGVTSPVDTGFLVFNHRTYPNLVRLFDTLGVPTAKSEMTFSVSVERAHRSNLEWAGHDLNAVFAQRANLLNPQFLGMLRDLLRFNRMATAMASDATSAAETMPLGDFLDAHHFSQAFRDWYLLPMAAAIWSCSTAQMASFPLATFVRFCHNHGLLQVNDRPQWYTVVGGAREYVKKLVASISHVRRAEPATRIVRGYDPSGQVAVHTANTIEAYDHVVMAAHSDETLALLADASMSESRVLGAIGYQPNHAVLHTDASVLPKRKKAWAAWNYQCRANAAADGAVCVHYLLNHLQPVPFTRPVMVSLNPFERPREESILQEFEYSHPVFDAKAIAAQALLPTLQGQRNTWFAGAWTGYGFHEDGLKSGFAVADAILALPARIAATAAREAALV